MTDNVAIHTEGRNRAYERYGNHRWLRALTDSTSREAHLEEILLTYHREEG